MKNIFTLREIVALKKYVCSISMVLAVLVIFGYGCSKNSSEPPPGQKDYSALFKNKVWTGKFQQNSGDWLLPYSIAFTDGDSAIFYVNFDGVNRGTYTLEGNKLTCNFYNIQIKGTVTDADTLTDIQTPYPQGWITLDCKLNATTAQALDNTRWIGKNPVYSNQDTLILDFLPGNMVRVRDLYNVPYTREAGRIHFERTGVGPYFDEEFYFIHMADQTLLGQRYGGGVGSSYFVARKQ